MLPSIVLLFCIVACHVIQGTDGLKKQRFEEPNSDVNCPATDGPNPVLRPHKSDCQLFYICSGGIAYIKVCQHGLHFNPKRNACDYPENAKCAIGSTMSPKVKKGQITSLLSCPNASSAVLMLLPHETDCEKFYICSGGTAHPKSCISGLHFNPKINVCDFPQNVGCKKEVTKTPRIGSNMDDDVFCPFIDGPTPTLRPHKSDCQKFYICSGGTGYLKVCQPGLHFNPKVNACDYPNNAKCTTGEGREGKKNDNLTKDPEGATLCPLSNDVVPELRPHETDCDKFYVCKRGTPVLKVCKPGLHFNPILRVCDYPGNAGCSVKGNKHQLKEMLHDIDKACLPSSGLNTTILVPDPFDCSKFVMCVHGKAHARTCPKGLHFSSLMQACDYPPKAKCKLLGTPQWTGVSSPFCPEVNGKDTVFFPHPSNCSVYYMCSHGLAYEFECPARLHFNVRQKLCDYEEKANCSAALAHSYGNKLETKRGEY